MTKIQDFAEKREIFSRIEPLQKTSLETSVLKASLACRTHLKSSLIFLEKKIPHLYVKLNYPSLTKHLPFNPKKTTSSVFSLAAEKKSLPKRPEHMLLLPSLRLILLAETFDQCSEELTSLMGKAVEDYTETLKNFNLKKQEKFREQMKNHKMRETFAFLDQLTFAFASGVSFAVSTTLIATGVAVGPGIALFIGSSVSLGNRILLEAKAYKKAAEVLFPNNPQMQTYFQRVFAIGNTAFQATLGIASCGVSLLSFSSQLPQLAQIAVQAGQGAACAARGTTTILGSVVQAEGKFLEKDLLLLDADLLSTQEIIEGCSESAKKHTKVFSSETTQKILQEEENAKQKITETTA